MTKRVHPEENSRASKAMELVARARWVRQHRTDVPGEATQKRHSSSAGAPEQVALEKDMRRRMSLGRASEYNAAAAATRGYEARFFETFVVRKVWAEAAHGGDRRMHAWTLLNEPSSSRGAMAWAWLILVVVLASIGLLLMRSLGGSDEYHQHTSYADAVCNIVLAIDWVVRCALYASIERHACCAPRGASATARLPGMKALLLDGLAVLPYIVLTRFGTRSIRGDEGLSLHCDGIDGTAERRACVGFSLLAALRLLRLLSLCRHYSGTRVLLAALRKSGPALAVPFSFLAVVGCCFALLIFYAEQLELASHADRDSIQFESLADALWFTLVTFSTVGYGDYSPKSHMGKALTSVAILLGVIFFAMPLTIVGSNFESAWQAQAQARLVARLQEELLRRGLMAHDLVQILSQHDLDDSGELEYPEFKQLCRQLGVAIAPSELRDVFNALDEDRSGAISYKELCHAVFPNLEVDAWDAQLWRGSAGNVSEQGTATPSPSERAAGSSSKSITATAAATTAAPHGFAAASSTHAGPSRRLSPGVSPFGSHRGMGGMGGMMGKPPRRLSPLVDGGVDIDTPGSSFTQTHSLHAELAALRRAQAAQGEALRSMMAGYARLGDRIEDLCSRLDHAPAEPLPTAQEEAAGADAAATTAASDDDASLLPRSELDSSGLVRAGSKHGSGFLDVVHQMTASVLNQPASGASIASVDEPQ